MDKFFKTAPLFVSGGGFGWSGKGRKPDWLQQELDRGESLVEYLNPHHADYQRTFDRIAVPSVVKVKVKVSNKDHRHNGQVFTFHRRAKTFLVEKQCSVASILIERVRPNARYVASTDGERLQVTADDKWVAIECLGLDTGKYSREGVVAFGDTPEQAYSNGFNVVW